MATEFDSIDLVFREDARRLTEKEVSMLHEFLVANETEILAMTESKTITLAGVRESSAVLRTGLPIFYQQLMAELRSEQKSTDESTAVAISAGLHGSELQRLGYTLSHVVHAYGAMCQSITELAAKKNIVIAPDDFRQMNMCLDVAIAGALTEYQSTHDNQEDHRELQHLRFLAHELRNSLSTVTVALGMIKGGTVGLRGSTSSVVDQSLKRIEDLIDRSLTQVHDSVKDPKK
jgi:hypothetical protein